MEFVKIGFAVTKQGFLDRVEGYIVGAMGEYCKAEVAAANGYMDYVEHWKKEVERLLFLEMSFFIDRAKTKAGFDRRKAIDEILPAYASAEDFRRSLLAAKKVLAMHYLKRPHADLRLPDVETSNGAFWLMVNEAVNLALEE